jgi:hypothetical protein
MDDKPMASDPLVLSVMETFASRAGAELERVRAFDSIHREKQESDERFRDLFEEPARAVSMSASLRPVGATPFAKQQVKAQSQFLNRPERSIQRNRLQPNGLLTIGRNFTHLSDEDFQDIK